ncbi:protein REPRESSOR OF SILENCING 3 [Andrographis paniculata]|uniref:protein REPRESSOR OF SILENCING 3 n=1 Tax=Andrographis paniculata TaxID=175694 RepID=UPI0021E861F0|nr:protein REPRESSOR OF SILENCING 3 [Andrographis paniculata]
MRIYIGGLGSSVQEDDLKKRFTSSQLGTVESVEIIRSKGRGFGYLEFVPASEKGLAKLFSTYNGCVWKGGRLKLEKAREHYLSRLQREWEEEAELKSKSSGQDADEDVSAKALEKPKILQDIDKMQLKLFFPKLRKIKPIPLKGTGKHKYSFQRVEAPSLPIHFCDCEQHSGPPVATRNRKEQWEIKDREIGIYEVNENELNMMKTILDNLLAKENFSKKIGNETDFTEEPNNDIIDSDNKDEMSDEDDLLINMTSRSSKRVAVLEDWGQKTTTLKNQDFTKPVDEMRGNKKGRLLIDKKRKLSDESEINAAKRARHSNSDDPVATNTEQTDTELSRDATNSRKSAWKDLVREKGVGAFHISDIFSIRNPEADVGEKVEQDDDDRSREEKESKPLLDDQSSEPTMVDDKTTARGAAWLQKSSWLQLVADANAFSIGQILPGVTFENPESQLAENASSNSRSDIVEPRGSDCKDVKSSRDDDRSDSDSDSKQAVENNDEALNYRAISDVVVSETCPFMRNAASLKEWTKTKAALSGARKKKGKGKTPDEENF